MNDHKYDSAGICIYCDLCPDKGCCPDHEIECDRRIVHEWSRMMERIRELYGPQGSM